MMQSNGGLLGAFSGSSQGASSAPLGGGLLASGTAPGGGMQLALQLSQNPTPEMARQIIAQLHQMKNPEATQFEQVLGGAMNNPQALKQIADAVLQKMGGQNA